MKKCPFCAEEIQDEAIKCKHCNEFLSTVQVRPGKAAWYFSTTFLVIGFCCVGPFVLPLVWVNPRFSITVKIVISFVMLVMSWMLWQALAQAMVHIQKYFNLLKGIY